MKRILKIAFTFSACTLVLAAQEELAQTRALSDKNSAEMRVQLEKMVAGAKILSFEGGVMGPAVKGAPYSADEVRESNQVLGDGTRIHNESKVTIYRDSEGRVRRESPNEITIWDPASGTNYVLNPKNMTARKMSLQFTYAKTGNGASASLSGGAGEKGMVTFNSVMTLNGGESPHLFISGDERGRVESGMIVRRNAEGKKESLGNQTMEGLNVQGDRVTNTIEQGAIGNDRPIQMVVERWYSPELQTYILTKRTDPRNGDETMRLTNVHRGEQSPVLFEVPPGYTVLGAK